MTSDCVLIDVLFLSVVDPHQGLDRLDHTLRVSDEVSIGILGSKSGPKLSQKTRQMDDLAMGPTHSPQPVIIGQEFCKFGINLCLVIPLVFDDLSRNDFVCL